MRLPRDATLLRIFFGEDDKFHGKPLYECIVLKAREMHLGRRHGAPRTGDPQRPDHDGKGADTAIRSGAGRRSLRPNARRLEKIHLVERH